LNTVEAYNPTTNIWTTKESMPTASTGLAAAVVNGRLYAIGGANNVILNTVEAYDPATDTWTTVAPMPTARAFLAVGVVHGILYAVGGENGVSYLNTVEAYNPTTNTWSTKASMPTALVDHAVGVVHGILYAVGGYNGISVLNNLRRFRRRRHRECRGRRPQLDAVGGYFNQALSTVKAYNPTTNTWHAKASMPTARNYLTAGVVNKILYAIGGDSGSGVLNTNEAFNPL